MDYTDIVTRDMVDFSSHYMRNTAVVSAVLADY